MRISTPSFHNTSISSMLSQQALLSRTQNQIASGKRVQTPADDPVAAVHLLELDRALNELDQFDRNSAVAVNRLSLEEQALADAVTLLQRVRELAMQANSPTVDDASRRMIAKEIQGRLQDLIGLANQRDANGEFLFSGYATQTQPFNQHGPVVEYDGDQGSRTIQVSSTQHIADSHSGYEVFVAIPSGNGTFVTAASATNVGTGVISSGTVVDPAAWEARDYTLRFISPTTYQIFYGDPLAPTVVATGTYTPTTENTSIEFNGVQVTFSGEPETGDTFTISRSRTEDVFTTLNELVATLNSSTVTRAARAQFSSRMAGSLQQLQQTIDHLLTVRAEVGVRIAALETADATRADQKLELQRMQSELRDLDYAEAISRMHQQLVGLQAAQMSYLRISQMSLFDYLR
jgi:flagellar hook-associated protein 3 FlgL